MASSHSSLYTHRMRRLVLVVLAASSFTLLCLWQLALSLPREIQGARRQKPLLVCSHQARGGPVSGRGPRPVLEAVSGLVQSGIHCFDLDVFRSADGFWHVGHPGMLGLSMPPSESAALPCVREGTCPPLSALLDLLQEPTDTRLMVFFENKTPDADMALKRELSSYFSAGVVHLIRFPPDGALRWEAAACRDRDPPALCWDALAQSDAGAVWMPSLHVLELKHALQSESRPSSSAGETCTWVIDEEERLRRAQRAGATCVISNVPLEARNWAVAAAGS